MSERDQAERFDEALAHARDRNRDGLPETSDDPELQSLLNLALRLEQELPKDLPDPEFRLRLKEQLTGRHREGAGASSPVDLGATRRRRSMFYDWRYGVAAAALVIMVTVAVVAGQGLRDGANDTSPALPTLVTALGSSDSRVDPQSRAESTKTVTDTRVLPPIDQAHVVQLPSGRGAGGGAEATPSGTPTPGITLAAYLPGLLPMASTYLLAAPAPATTFVENVTARLGATAEVKQVDQGSEQIVQAIDDSGIPIVQWNAREAYFIYQRGLKQQTPPPGRAQTDPRETARAWLEEIGFDLTTIRYVAVLEENQGQGPGPSLVRFTPIDLPSTEPQASITMLVGVASDGTIEFANGFWFSLVESAEAPLRDSQSAWQAIQAGEGFSFTFGTPAPETSMRIKTVKLSYLLTRADDRSYVLQPVVEFSGPAWTPAGEVLDSLYVTAVEK